MLKTEQHDITLEIMYSKMKLSLHLHDFNFKRFHTTRNKNKEIDH